MWHSAGVTSPITYLSPAPAPSSSASTSGQTFAVSYTDGSIRLWNYAGNEATEAVTFNGHKKGVNTLAWDSDGGRLASGGTEGEVVVWDCVAEVGLFRLRGHRGAVTGIHFIPHPELPATQHAGYLVTTSRDTYLKLWDLSTQHCVQTVVVGRGEVWSSAVSDEGERWIVLTGSGDGEVKAWTLAKSALAEGLKENEQGEVSDELAMTDDSSRLWCMRFARFHCRRLRTPCRSWLSTLPCRSSTRRLPTGPPLSSDCDLRRK